MLGGPTWPSQTALPALSLSLDTVGLPHPTQVQSLESAVSGKSNGNNGAAAAARLPWTLETRPEHTNTSNSAR